MFRTIPNRFLVITLLFGLFVRLPLPVRAQPHAIPFKRTASVCVMTKARMAAEVRYMNAFQQVCPVLDGVPDSLDMRRVNDLQTLKANAEQAQVDLAASYRAYKAVPVPVRFRKGDKMLRLAFRQFYRATTDIKQGLMHMEQGVTPTQKAQAHRGIVGVGQAMITYGRAELEIGRRMEDFSREVDGGSPIRARRSRR